jgi:hypothetical protein
LLSEPFSHIADFVAHNFASVVALTLANEFAPQGPLASRHFRPRNKDENFQVLEAADLILGTGNLVFLLRGCECFRPQGVIVRVHFQLQEAICGCCKDLRDRLKISSRDIDREKVVGITKWYKLSQKGKHIAIILVRRRR